MLIILKFIKLGLNLLDSMLLLLMGIRLESLLKGWLRHIRKLKDQLLLFVILRREKDLVRKSKEN